MRKTRIISEQEVLDFIKSPLGIAICGIIATLMAFLSGIAYARNTAELVYSHEDFCSLRIGGVQETFWEDSVNFPDFQ